jgi:glucose-6-phosphate 1-dehydrogenase
MGDNGKPDPTIITILGASGDLTWRKLVPAIFSLSEGGWLPEKFAIVGLDRNTMSNAKYREHLCEGVTRFTRGGKPAKKSWDDFAQNVSIHSLDFTKADSYHALDDILDKQDVAWECRATRVFYLATPPELIGTIVGNLSNAGLCRDCGLSRVVIEKPFGRDLQSARSLNQMLARNLEESQIFRIDHYLGKETVQNLMALRFANALYEPLWNSAHIDHVQITVAESVGLEGRAGYYDKAGALRDMVQNHLLQLLCLVAMEPPSSMDAEAVRDEKLKVLRSARYRTMRSHNTPFAGSTQPVGCAVSTSSPIAMKRMWIPTRTPRHLPRFSFSLTIGAGRAYRFICVPANGCHRACPKCPSISARCRIRPFRTAPSARCGPTRW